MNMPMKAGDIWLLVREKTVHRHFHKFKAEGQSHRFFNLDQESGKRPRL
jgi:hypothetical protein